MTRKILAVVLGVWVSGGAASVCATDCNQNGVEDSIDLADVTSLDCNANGVPDECDLVAQKRFGTQLGSRPATLTTGGNPSRAVAVDLDGDGDLEVVVTRANLGERYLLVFPNAGDGSFLAPVPIPVGEPQWGIDAGDLDGDGDPDLAVTLLHADQVVILWNQMNLRFAPAPPLPAGDNPEALMIRDLDRDGDLDMAVTNGLSRDVSIFENLNANGQPGVFVPRFCCSGVGGLPLDDLDKDGDPDMVGVHVSTGGVYLWPNGGWCSPGSGDGTFGAPVVFPSGGSVPHHVAAGDLNGDGAVDLVVAHLGSDDIVVHLNAGGNCTGPPVFVAMPAIPVPGGEPQLGADPKFVELGDLDRDGDLDLMVPNQRSDDVAVFCNNGDATFGSPERRPVGRQPCFARFADLDGDGDLDAMVPNVNADTVSLLWMELEPFSRDCNTNGVPDECDIAGGLDCNGNDIVDSCDISNGFSDDCNANEIPDECENPIEDVTPPLVSCPENQFVECTTPEGVPVEYGPAEAADRCDGEVDIDCNPPSGTVFPLGSTLVQCTATDQSGNQALCTFEVTVMDTTAPVIRCPADVVVECASFAGTPLDFEVTANDTCDPEVDIQCEPPSGSVFPLGLTVVSCTATDERGNLATCSFEVTVVDTTSPEVTCPENKTVECDGRDGAIVDFDLPVATDACAAELVVTCDPSSGSVFPIGETIVRCTVTDRSGNVTECRFNVVVICLVLPCDYNQDGVFDLSDPVALLNHLFLGGAPPPCGDRTVFDPSNIALLDCNGDGGVDLSDAVCKLSYLFLGGAPPFPVARALAAGRRCIAVSNCESACVDSHP
jgi:hypothetical protein